MKTMMTMVAAVAAMSAIGRAQEDIDPRKRDAANKLSGLKVTVDFTDVTLTQAVDYLRDMSGMNFHVDGKCAEKADAKVSLKVKDLSLKTVLKLLLTPQELTAIWRDGVLVVLPKSAVASATYVQVYDVRDLMARIADFPGPKVELVSGGGGGPLVGVSVSFDEPAAPPITEDLMIELVKGNTGGNSWEDPSCSITYANGLFVVSQSKGAHAEVGSFLNKLRQFK